MSRLHLCCERMVQCLVFLVIVLRAMSVAAAPCLVPSSSHPTVQAAVIDARCATVNVAAGTYTELVTINRSVMIRGDGQDSTVIDGSGAGPVFTINSGTVMIRAWRIRTGETRVLFA